MQLSKRESLMFYNWTLRNLHGLSVWTNVLALTKDHRSISGGDFCVKEEDVFFPKEVTLGGQRLLDLTLNK